MKLFRSKSEENKEPYDEFIATVKLVSGEEILTKVIVDYTTTVKQVILDNPVVCQEVRSMGANVPLGYKFEPWIKMSDEPMYVIDIARVITISEIKDNDVISTYDQIVSQGFTRSHPDLTKDMGFVNSVEKARKAFEKSYEITPNPPTDPKAT